MAAIEQIRNDYGITPNSLHCLDALDLCSAIAAGSANLILADLPYGVTENHWGTVIPLPPLWQAFKRVLAPGGCILLTATQPFASQLVTSAPRGWFRFEWIWIKPNSTNWLNAKVRPMIVNESVLVFAPTAAPYYPIMVKGEPYKSKQAGNSLNYKHTGPRISSANEGLRFPQNVLYYPLDPDNVHPTQKPLAMFEYLIRTHSRPGDLVLDPTCGSGTTAIAARNTERLYIVGDSDPHYAEVARKRIEAPIPLFCPVSGNKNDPGAAQ